MARTYYDAHGNVTGYSTSSADKVGQAAASYGRLYAYSWVLGIAGAILLLPAIVVGVTAHSAPAAVAVGVAEVVVAIVLIVWAKARMRRVAAARAAAKHSSAGP